MSGRRPKAQRNTQRKPKLVVESSIKLQTSGVNTAALNAIIADYKQQGYEVIGRQGTRGGGVTLVRKKKVATAANLGELAGLFGGLSVAGAAEPKAPPPTNRRMNALVAGIGGLQVGGRRRKTHRRRR